MLVAPLNWGLGHATRCIPIINGLQNAGFEPILASDGDALILLKKEFPNLTSYQLPSYNINYSKRGNTLKLKLFLSIPSVLKAVKKEKKLVLEIIEKENILGIISDNRFGVFSSEIPSVYITHQLNVLSGITTFFTSKIHQKIASKYTEVWVPDFKGNNNFSGKLSSTSNLKVKIKIIGILSRFKFEKKTKKHDFTIVLSGIEPQRTLLEQKLLNEFKNTSNKVLLIRGKLSEENIQTSENIEVVNFLTSEELNTALNESEMVICRSGYSSIMDLARLGKKAFFIPTAGQNEQEYLAKRMKELTIASFCKQDDFSIEKLQEIENYKGFKKIESNVDLKLFSLFQSK